MSKTGTYTLKDLQDISSPTVTQFGLEAVQEAVQNELQAHNLQVGQMLADYAQPTTEREEADATGQLLDGVMEKGDEFSRARTQKPDKAGKVGFPLEKFIYAIGWTAEYLQNATPAQIATATLNAERAHRRMLLEGVRGALFRPTNYTFNDYLTTNPIDIGVRALFNGDGNVPPLGPNLEEFDGAHTHFLAVNGLTVNAANSLILTVAEHTNDGNVRIHINVAQEAAWRGLTGFVPLTDVRVRVGADQVIGQAALDTSRINNRLIGYFNGAEVWVKPWIYNNYALALDANARVKALSMREHADASRRGLRTVAEIVTYPLQSQYMEAWVGFGVKNRGAAAALYTGGGAYVDPTV